MERVQKDWSRGEETEGCQRQASMHIMGSFTRRATMISFYAHEGVSEDPLSLKVFFNCWQVRGLLIHSVILPPRRLRCGGGCHGCARNIIFSCTAPPVTFLLDRAPTLSLSPLPLRRGDIALPSPSPPPSCVAS